MKNTTLVRKRVSIRIEKIKQYKILDYKTGKVTKYNWNEASILTRRNRFYATKFHYEEVQV